MIRALLTVLAAATLVQAAPPLPLTIEPQSSPGNHYVARSAGYSALLAADGLRIRNGAADVRLRFAGADRDAAATPINRLAGASNYLLGSDTRDWRVGVPHYGRVEYREIYPGIDLAYYGAGARIEYDFIVAPGADPRRIEIAVEGADCARVTRQGALDICTSSGLARQSGPVAYQQVGDRRVEVAARYIRRGPNRFAVEVGGYRRDLPIIIDPVLSYSTFFGAEGTDTANAIAVDGAGNVYIAGTTSSSTFGSGLAWGGAGDAFVAKVNATATALAFVTYIGGSATDVATGVRVDDAGSAYIVGDSASTNFPTTAAALNKTCCGVFVAKLNPAGNGLDYATFVGPGEAKGIAIDATGSAYITGSTTTGFPVTAGGYQRAYAGLADAFVAKLASAGNVLIYSTLLGGAQADVANAIAVDAAGNAHVAGTTESTAFPVTSAILATGGTSAGKDAFVSKLSADGSQLLYSTLIGTPSADEARAIAIDAAGNAYVTGKTDSTIFPTISGSYLTFVAAGFAPYGYAAKLSPTGANLVYGTYLGTGGAEGGTGIAVDSTGSAYITGSTETGEFPTTPNAFQAAKGGSADAIIARLNQAGSIMLYATHLGGSSYDYGRAIAVDGAGNAYVAGSTASTNFPVTSLVLQSTKGAGGDSFIARIDNSTLACSYSLSAITQNMSAVAANGSVEVTTGNGCAWFASSNSSWITISAGASRVGSGPVEFSVTANDSTTGRTGTLTIAGQTYTVIQAGSTCTYTIVPSSVTFDADGGIASITVTAPTGCAWTAASGATWITVNQGASGSGTGLIRYTVQANPGAARTGTMLIAGQTFTVSQGGIGCSYSISPQSLSIGGDTSSNTVTVTTPAACPWTASSNASWMTINSGATGVGTGAVQFSVTANTGSPRVGTISVAGQTFTLSQSSANCVTAVNPGNLTVPETGGNFSASVVSPASCSWRGQASLPWISFIAGSGSGTAPITFAVAPNPTSSSRTGFVILGAQSIVVTQNAPGSPACGFTLSSTSLGILATGQSGTVNLSAASETCPWTATSNTSWVQVFPLSGSGPRTISYTVYPNFTTNMRTGTVLIAGQTLTFVQLAPGGSETERFVGLMYFNALGRIAVPSEVAFHVASLNAGLPRANWVNSLFNSEEFNTAGRFIAGLYVGLLNRDPDFQGWLFQRNALATGLLDQQALVANFLGSTEFQLRYGNPSNDEFVRILYRNILLREPAIEEVALQAAALAAGTPRVTLATAFLNSPEFRAGSGPRLTAFLLYAVLLMRDAGPSELATRAAQVQSGIPVVTLMGDFLASAEFAPLLR